MDTPENEVDGIAGHPVDKSLNTPDVDVRCSKDDEYPIAMCRCLTCLTERNQISEIDGHMVNDDLLVGWGAITDIVWFVCPVCNEKSVAVTPKTGELGRYCLNESCRVKVTIQSDELKKYIESRAKI